MPNTVWRKVALALVAAAILAACLLPAPQTGALPCYSWSKYYFTDATYTVWIGERALYCNGSRYSEGSTSAYWYYAFYESCGCY